MSRVLQTTRRSWSRTRRFAAGLLIGATTATPAFAAAPEFITDEWKTVLLLGSVVLLGIGLLLKVHSKRSKPTLPAWSSPPEPNRYTIGQNRPNAFQ